MMTREEVEQVIETRRAHRFYARCGCDQGSLLQDHERRCTNLIAVCVNCGAVQGHDATTHCPHRKLTVEERERIIGGVLDYRAGSWVRSFI